MHFRMARSKIKNAYSSVGKPQVCYLRHIHLCIPKNNKTLALEIDYTQVVL